MLKFHEINGIAIDHFIHFTERVITEFSWEIITSFVYEIYGQLIILILLPLYTLPKIHKCKCQLQIARYMYVDM